MANAIDETGASYISKLAMNSTTYTIKDAWARAEIAEIESAIAGGVHFRGVSQTAIADGDSVKAITLTDGETTIAAADQANGDIFIYNNGKKNLEFVVSGGKYSEFGSTGELGALAFADTASGSTTVDIAGAITFADYTPNVSKGTLAVTTGNDTITVTSTADTATGSFSPAALTIAASTVTLTPTKGTFTALKDVTYNSTTATLTISDGTSDEFWKSATGEAAGQTVTPTANQTISVSYQKVTPVAEKTFLTSSSLTGDLAVTAAAPTATITNPTITVTVSPVSD
jgi:hypothetical protein